MQAIILDTETHTLNGQPIEIAYAPVEIVDHKLSLDKSRLFDQLYSCDEPISFAAMAVHHILQSDLDGQPHYSSFELPTETTYIIGHNIDYDIRALEKCGVDSSNIKAICTLALARRVWPEAEAHNISALIYMITKGSERAREMIRKAHRADMDIILTANILMHIVHHLKINSLEELYAASEDARIPRSINFGKHRGTAIAELPADYVQWLLRQDELDPYLRKALENAAVLTL
ncbi:3'-5' exonuclease [Acinetobacter sp. RF15A]|uniref:3'-5' exonuclease n=1 Tax=Acinetobacter lwoffii TaxID=28090 RepID=A0A9D2UU09_ACILW|nr:MULTISPECIES: exonuclease domain-containing protein [unclassified Acinetobacter]MDM1780573.1 3'-5' exonuclease [Acinetobacter indicus]HJF28617.1 3'-5' exonuclease [Acinetobacter lwoffii]QKQ69559.1 3'-5' exonuclease [Acinetobacter sp. 10FS3-1]TSH77983.1 3'-5' exonuclease [Acinetobacter sp. RF15A]TSI19972.1 3'-5' exonuclease [Acinetobacter sp. RF15B]